MTRFSKIDPRGMLVLAVMFFLVYGANSLIPLCFGDDYLYSFVWEENQKFYEPLPETARRVSSWQDYFDSLWAHYFSHSGRLVNFLPIFFFLWQGKEYFNIFNTLLFVLLMAEVYWLSNRGRIGMSFKPSRIWWIFFSLWTFTVGFFNVFMWLTGACNYLWPAVLTLGFLLPYVRAWLLKDIQLKIEKSPVFMFFIFLLGISAGWTNENTGCCIVPLLTIMLWKKHGQKGYLALWEIIGLVGFTLGYILLMVAPGNFVRLSEDMVNGSYSTDLLKNFYNNGITFLIAIFFQMPLWMFLSRSLNEIKRAIPKTVVKNEVMAVEGFVVLSLCSNAVMLFFPEYPLRSTFPSLLYLIVAACMAADVQQEMKCSAWDEKLTFAISVISGMYVLFTVCVSFYGWGRFNHYNRYIIESVREFKNNEDVNGKILEVNPIDTPAWIYPASGFHSIAPMLREDPSHWMNAAYARYYGIYGICTIFEKQEVEN